MKKGTFDLEDFLTTFKQIKKLGPLENILKMLPGARNMGLNNINIDPKDMAHIEAIILSMTPYERRHPEVLKASRKIRIAKGSGRSVEEVNRYNLPRNTGDVDAVALFEWSNHDKHNTIHHRGKYIL